MAKRFESMLATAIALGESGRDRAAQSASWRQIVDILAQGGTAIDPGIRHRALTALASARDRVASEERRMTAVSLAGRTRDPQIVALFAADAPGVAAPILARAELRGPEWQAILPTMPAAARNILRNRRDLPATAVAMLAYYAHADLALPTGSPEAIASEAASPATGPTPIRDLVDRIAAYRQRVPMPVAEADRLPATDRFTFETTLDGLIDWVEGAPRPALAGLAIGEMAAPGCPGVDGQAAGAFRRRAPFRDARLLVGGAGPAGGDWLISAAPLFNPRTGRFCGYRGEARRPLPGERVGGATPVDGVAPDSLRQLVHELRTPLNAIQGFAQMIDQQILGPAAQRYRERARAILADAARLTAMVDDLDTVARMDSGRTDEDPVQQPDIAAITAAAIAIHRGPLAARGVEIALNGGDVERTADIAESTAERMIARLLAATTSVATPGETVCVDVKGDGASVVLTVSRPLALEGRDERTLLDPGYGPEGDWPDAPLLGLGFTLRLVARLATQARGGLEICEDRFELRLPSTAVRAATR